MMGIEDENLVSRAQLRVLGAITVSAKIDGEMAQRLDARVYALDAEHGHYTRADVIRSALRLYLDAVDAEAARRDELTVLPPAENRFNQRTK
jgi:Arc/MetJ-type ribon-helix-helix transcriptional regulator